MTLDLPLKKLMEAVGVEEIFNSNADLSGINPKRELMVSDAFHKAFVEVNEEGTEAAAATGIVVGMMAAFPADQPPNFIADHPFVFAIRHNPSKMILFLGRMVEPPK